MSIEPKFCLDGLKNNIPPIVTPVFNSVIKQKNINTITLDKQIGKGGYGTVYICRNEKNEELAVKCIKNKDSGIPSLMEATIMSSIRHPNIAHAIKIHSTPQKLYIVQELALSDLRVYRQENIIKNIKTWVYDIAQAINCLHQYDIIHGDIKASNILVYHGDKVKLADFTLSTNKNWKNYYKPCTSTHRPLEVWLGEKWDKSVDIWAFGCTVFEMIYGSTLFVNQNKEASINALLDWHNYLPCQYKPFPINIKRYDIFHYTFNLPSSFTSNDSINSLILSMLTTSPQSRPSINYVLNNSIFTEMKSTPFTIINTPTTALLPKTEKKVRLALLSYIPNTSIEIAYDLYVRITGLINANDKLKLVTCAWIANKITERESISLALLPFELHEILHMERIICNYLSYRLYYKSTQVIFREKKMEK